MNCLLYNKLRNQFLKTKNILEAHFIIINNWKRNYISRAGNSVVCNLDENLKSNFTKQWNTFYLILTSRIYYHIISFNYKTDRSFYSFDNPLFFFVKQKSWKYPLSTLIFNYFLNPPYPYSHTQNSQTRQHNNYSTRLIE